MLYGLPKILNFSSAFIFRDAAFNNLEHDRGCRR